MSVTSFKNFEKNWKMIERKYTGELLYFIPILHISNRALNLKI